MRGGVAQCDLGSLFAWPLIDRLLLLQLLTAPPTPIDLPKTKTKVLPLSLPPSLSLPFSVCLSMSVSLAVSSSQLIVHSSRVLTPKRHQSESVLYLHDNELTLPATAATPTSSASSGGSSGALNSSPISEDAVPALRVQHRHSPSYPPVHTSMALHRFQQQPNYKLSPQSSLPELETGVPQHATRATLRGQSQSTGDLQQQQQLPRAAQKHKSSISVTISSSEAVVTIAPQPPPSKPQLSKLELHSCSAPNVAASGVEQGEQHSPASSYRSNHRLFPVSTYTEPAQQHSNTSQYVQHPKPQFSANLHKSAK